MGDSRMVRVFAVRHDVVAAREEFDLEKEKSNG
jgi:hypothetical protein